MTKNIITTRQFILLAIFLSLASQVLVLPQLLLKESGNMAWAVSLIGFAFQSIVFGIIWWANHIGNFWIIAPTWIKKSTALFISFSCILQFFGISNEFSSFCCTFLFDNMSYIFIIFVIVVCCFFVIKKSINCIAKTCELAFWLLAFTILFNIFFATYDGKIGNLFPMSGNTLFGTFWDNIYWYCNFTPLLVCSFKPQDKLKFGRFMLYLVFMILPCISMVGLTFIYGYGAQYIDFGLANISIFNKLATIIGLVDLPTTASIIFVAIIKLLTIFTSFCMCMRCFFSKIWANFFIILTSIIIIAVMYATLVDPNDIINSCKTWIGYIIVTLELIIPLNMLFCNLFYHRKRYTNGINYSTILTKIR